MRRTFCNLGKATLATYLVAWLCIAPVLVICTCLQGQTEYTFLDHAEAACDHDHGSEPSSHGPVVPADDRAPDRDQDREHDHQHQDQKVQSDELFASVSSSAAPVDLAAGTALLYLIDEQATTPPPLAIRYRSHGPPQSVHAAIASTILLI